MTQQDLPDGCAGSLIFAILGAMLGAGIGFISLGFVQGLGCGLIGFVIGMIVGFLLECLA